jgi:nicotinamide mononucleotide transporter
MPAEEVMSLPVHLFDFLGASLGFIATCYYIRVNVWAWPISLIAYLVDITLYFYSGLYADSILNVFFFALTLYGWQQWLRGGSNSSTLPISNLTFRVALWLAVIAVGGTVLGATLLHAYTDSQVPWWDALTAVLSLIAQWLTCKKIIQNWQFWFVIDVMYAGMYFYKGIPLHAFLQIIYLGMAVIGYCHWKRQYLAQEPIFLGN